MHKIIKIIEKLPFFNYIYWTETLFTSFELLFITLISIRKEAFPYFWGVGEFLLVPGVVMVTSLE